MIAEAGYSKDIYIFGVGENILRTSTSGYLGGIEAFNSWVNSKGHRDNLLRKFFNYLGVGGAYKEIFYNEYYDFIEYYYTQDFVAQ